MMAEGQAQQSDVPIDAEPTVEIAADAYDPNTDRAVMKGTKHILVDGQLLCNHPRVRQKIASGSYHVEAEPYPLSQRPCKTCAERYVAEFGSADPVYQLPTNFEAGDWIQIQTEAGDEYTGRIRHTGERPTFRSLTVVLSDEARARWVYGVETEATVRIGEGETPEIDGQPIDTIEQIQEPVDSIDRQTRAVLDVIREVGGDAVSGVRAAGSEPKRFSARSVDGLDPDDVDALADRLVGAGFDLEDVIYADDRHDRSSQSKVIVSLDQLAVFDADRDKRDSRRGPTQTDLLKKCDTKTEGVEWLERKMDFDEVF